MKTCRTCGREVGNWEYCGFCGTKLDKLDLSFQKTNTLLRQNVVLYDDAGNTESSSDLSRRVSGQYVDTHQPIDTADLQDTQSAAVDVRTTCEQKSPDKAPVVDNETTDPISNSFSFVKTDLFSDNPVIEHSFEEEDAAAEHETPNLQSLTEDTALETVVQDNVEFTHDEYPSAVQSAVPDHAEEPMMTDRVTEPVFPTESATSDTENTLNNGSTRLLEEAVPLADDSEAEANEDTDTELPLNLGSLFNFTKPQRNESEADSENLEREIMPDYAYEDMIKASDDSPVIGMEPSDKIGVTTNDASEINDDTPIEDAVNSQEETDGFSKIDFESVDTAEDGLATFDFDTVGSDAVVEETGASIESEPSVFESEQGNPRQECQNTKPKPRPFDNIKSVAKPQISVADIDPMFGSAPTFDIDSIKASFQTGMSSEKKKSRKGFFNRKRNNSQE